MTKTLWAHLWGVTLMDGLTRATVAALIVLTGLSLKQVVAPAPAFVPVSLQIPVRAPIPAGCPIDVVLRYRQQGAGAASLGLFWAARGRLTSVPLGLYDLPDGEHVVAFLVEVPRWIPPGSYRLYLVRSGITWFGRPESGRIESDALEIIPPGPPCPPLTW